MDMDEDKTTVSLIADYGDSQLVVAFDADMPYELFIQKVVLFSRGMGYLDSTISKYVNSDII